MNKMRNSMNENKLLACKIKPYTIEVDEGQIVNVKDEDPLTKAKDILKWLVNHCGDHDLFYAIEECRDYMEKKEK